tara:strand:+ start:118 stop:453 length:336 start_codon:yes stop_codon:yes gene_type:complete
MEKFIKDYGILILVGVAVYWFFIRKKEEEVLAPADEASGYRGRRYIPRYIQENPCGNPCAGSDCPAGTTCQNNAPGTPCGYSCEGAASSAGTYGVGPVGRRKYRRRGRRYY